LGATSSVFLKFSRVPSLIIEYTMRKALRLLRTSQRNLIKYGISNQSIGKHLKIMGGEAKYGLG
jgi:hypothetical protein